MEVLADLLPPQGAPQGAAQRPPSVPAGQFWQQVFEENKKEP